MMIASMSCKNPSRTFLARPYIHRFQRRHGVNCLLPTDEEQKASKTKSKDYLIDYLHMDFAEVNSDEGRQYLFVAIDRTSKVTFVEFHPRAKCVVAANFLRRVLEKMPHKAPAVLTDNRVQFIL